MGRSSNDDRSDRFNPNNDAYWAAEANEAAQGDDGDWDDSDEPPPVAGSLQAPTKLVAMSSKRHHAGCKPLTDRQMCGQIILDRQSHVLAALSRILGASWGYRHETIESAKRLDESQAIAMARVTRIIESLDERVRRNEYPRAPKSYGYSSYSADEEWPDKYRARLLKLRTLIEKGTRRQHKERLDPRYDTEGQAWPDADVEPSPIAEVRTLGWRDVFESISRRLALLLDETDRVHTSGSVAGTLITFDPRWDERRENVPPRSTEPGAFSVQRFTSLDELFARSLELTAPKEERRRDTDRRSEPVLMVIVSSGHAEADAHAVDGQFVQRTIDGLSAFLRPIPDWWNPAEPIRAAVRSARIAEWTGAAACVCGLSPWYLNDDSAWNNRSIDSWLQSPCRSHQEAVAYVSMMIRRGYRTMILETPMTSGPVSWAVSGDPESRHRHYDEGTELAEAAWSNRRTWGV